MKYDIISIQFVKDRFYDIKYRSRPWFRKPVELTERFESGQILASRVRDDKCFHNLKEVILAFDVQDCGLVEFDEARAPRPQMRTI